MMVFSLSLICKRPINKECHNNRINNKRNPRHSWKMRTSMFMRQRSTACLLPYLRNLRILQLGYKALLLVTRLHNSLTSSLDLLVLPIPKSQSLLLIKMLETQSMYTITFTMMMMVFTCLFTILRTS